MAKYHNCPYQTVDLPEGNPYSYLQNMSNVELQSSDQVRGTPQTTNHLQSTILRRNRGGTDLACHWSSFAHVLLIGVKFSLFINKPMRQENQWPVYQPISINTVHVHIPRWLPRNVGLSENSVPHLPNGFADHYPYFLWLFHWGYTPFSDIPMV